MRWLVVHPGPAFSVSDVYAGWVEALREHGEHVNEYNLGHRMTFYDTALQEIDKPAPGGVMRLRKALTTDAAVELAINGIKSACYQFWPDVVLVISYFFVNADLLDLLRDRGHRVVLVHTESPYQDDEQLKLAEHADVNLVNDPTNLHAFQALGAPAVYVPHCYRPSVHRPGPHDADLGADLAFIGTGFPSRIEFLEAMDLDGLDVLLAGNWQLLNPASPLRRYVEHEDAECIDNAEAVRVYQSAKAGLNLYRREAERPELADGYAMGPREVEMAAAGLFFLRDKRAEGDEVLWMLPTFTDPADASAKLRWWLAHDEERWAAARLARDAVADRTFHNAAARLLELLDRQPATP